MKRERELEDAVKIAINSCKDVTTLRRFVSSVDPVRWVEELQAHLEDALRQYQRREPKPKPRKRSQQTSKVPSITIGDYS